MWAPKDPHFIKDEASIFLLSSWEELFHGFTPDSYQPRLHNVASLVEELVDMSARCVVESQFGGQVAKIQAELSAAINDEQRVLARIPGYLSRAKVLSIAKTPHAILAGGQILMGEQENYWTAFKRHAIEAITNLPDKKSEALEGIRGLATFAFQHGKEDDDIWVPIRKDVDRMPLEIFQDMIDLVQAAEKEFVCTLTVLGVVDDMHSIVRSQGYRVVSSNSLPLSYRDEITAPGAQTLHVQTTVRASSIRNAVATARKKLGIHMGFVSMYTNPAALRIHSKALITYQGEEHVFVQTEQAFRRLHPRSNAKWDIEQAISLMSEHEVDRRVLAAIEQLALASSSSDTRTRLVSLWAAIETLAGAHEGETALERVCNLLAPLVISRHVHRTTRYLTIKLQSFGQLIGSSKFGSGFTNNKRRRVFQDDMLSTLTAKSGDKKITDLLGFVEHPLLRHRIYRTWEIYHNPRTLKSRLLASKQRLEWQLARIYRARNLLVHQGEEVRYIVPLLDNLQNYLSMLVQRMIHELKRHPEWSVRNLIEYWKGRMDHSLRCLDECPTSLATSDFLESGRNKQLWGC